MEEKPGTREVAVWFDWMWFSFVIAAMFATAWVLDATKILPFGGSLLVFKRPEWGFATFVIVGASCGGLGLYRRHEASRVFEGEAARLRRSIRFWGWVRVAGIAGFVAAAYLSSLRPDTENIGLLILGLGCLAIAAVGTAREDRCQEQLARIPLSTST